MDLPGGHFFEGPFVSFEDFLAFGVRQPGLHVIIPHQEINEIFEADPRSREVNPGELYEMQMGIMDAGFLWVPVVGEDFGLLSGTKQQAIAILLRGGLKLAFEIGMGNYAEDLREGDQVLRAVGGFNRRVGIIKNFVELR